MFLGNSRNRENWEMLVWYFLNNNLSFLVSDFRSIYPIIYRLHRPMTSVRSILAEFRRRVEGVVSMSPLLYCLCIQVSKIIMGKSMYI